MIEVEEIEGGLRVVDAAKNEVELEIEDWVPGGEELEIGRDVEQCIAGSASGIRTSGGSVVVDGGSRSGLRQITIDEKCQFSGGDHVVQLDDVIAVYVRTDSPFSVFLDPRTSDASITFTEIAHVTLGFRSHERLPEETLTVPPTVDGIAAAVSRFGDAHNTATADRSYPSLRGHPPLVELDEQAEMPTNDHSKESLRLRLPDSLESLFVVSPLAYYLSTDVVIEDVETPVLQTGKQEYHFTRRGPLQDEVFELLSRIFYLDCLVRNAGPNGMDIRERDLLKSLSFEAEEVYSQPLHERVAAYLKVEYQCIASALPEWPLSVSVEPTMCNVPTLPHLVYRLAAISSPNSNRVDGRVILERSIGDTYRSSGFISQGGADSPEILDPEGVRGVTHGWIADGVTLDAFDCPPEAFSNRLSYLDTTAPVSVLLVLNDEDMETEYSAVASVYEDHKNRFPLRVDVVTQPKTDELAAFLESSYDFLHYIGHCDPQGLRCTDGHLPASALSECSIQTFFLNACSSYEVGVELIRLGSVAGAVTIGDVLDKEAQKVGSAFGRLLCNGFAIDEALKISRSHAIIGRQYTTVGDGTHILTKGRHDISAIISITAASDRSFRVKAKSNSPKRHGSIYQAYTSQSASLLGSDYAHEVTMKELEWILEVSDHPFIYEDKFYWPEELLEELF